MKYKDLSYPDQYINKTNYIDKDMLWMGLKIHELTGGDLDKDSFKSLLKDRENVILKGKNTKEVLKSNL